jgi:hypothetical protein
MLVVVGLDKETQAQLAPVVLVEVGLAAQKPVVFQQPD